MFVLVDTSVWIDHLQRLNHDLISLLEQNLVLTHPAIIGELACGNLKKRMEVLDYLKFLPPCQEASHEEVFEMVERRNLFGKGLNWIDVHLLASAILSNAHLWTKDKNLKRFSSAII